MTDQQTLRDFLTAYQRDRNAWWRLSDGERQNLFDAALDGAYAETRRAEEAEAALAEALRRAEHAEAERERVYDRMQATIERNQELLAGAINTAAAVARVRGLIAKWALLPAATYREVAETLQAALDVPAGRES